MHALIHKGSNLGTGLRKLAGSSVITYMYRSSSQPDLRPKLNRIAEKLKNVIKCALNYIPEPIKHTKTSVFCYAFEFHSGIRQGSASMCQDKTTSKLSLTSSKI